MGAGRLGGERKTPEMRVTVMEMKKEKTEKDAKKGMLGMLEGERERERSWIGVFFNERKNKIGE